MTRYTAFESMQIKGSGKDTKMKSTFKNFKTET